MLEPMTAEEFASHTDTSVDDVERFRTAGYLDLDADGMFDAVDVLRLQFLMRHLGDGKDLAAFAEEIEASDNNLIQEAFKRQTVSYTPEEAAEKSGVPIEQLRAIGSALGYRWDEPFGEIEMHTAGLARTMLDAGMPFEGLLEGARVYTDALRRLSEASLEITHRYLCEPLIRSGTDEREVATQIGPAVDVIAPTAEALLRAMHREFMRRAALRHALTHLEPREPGMPPGSSRSTVVFVDLALFSTLAEMEGDEAAVRLVDRFDQTVRTIANVHEGTVVKQIGDEFMLIFHRPAAAVAFAVELQQTMARTDRIIALRTGIHHGTVLYRLGDYWGRTVNVAARIVSMAMSGSILVTEPVAKAAADEGIEVVELGVRELRGMEEPVGIYRVVIDPEEG